MIAIFDIGKTNKKFFVFDSDYKIILEESAVFDEIKDEDGFPCEDIHSISRWVLETFTKAATNKEFNITAINFSAHGASFVHINKTGEIIAPLYNYFKPFPEKLQAKFNEAYPLETICLETSSPALGNLNSGKQLYWLKYQRPDLFNQIKYSLHLPEYFTYLLTGKAVSGITSIGCHTMLWDFPKSTYHHWVMKEGIADKLAPIYPNETRIPFIFQGKELTCGIGLHDSSAALIPHLKEQQEPFVLLSTGTWNISLNPFNHARLTQRELNQDCLCYLTYQGNQVKASRLLGGSMYDEGVKLLAEKFHVDGSYFNSLSSNEWNDIKTEATKEYQQLMSNLINLQKQSTDLILTDSIKRIIVEGGFAKNKLFIILLADKYPEIQITNAARPQAGALGAAMLVQN